VLLFGGGVVGVADVAVAYGVSVVVCGCDRYVVVVVGDVGVIGGNGCGYGVNVGVGVGGFVDAVVYVACCCVVVFDIAGVVICVCVAVCGGVVVVDCVVGVGGFMVCRWCCCMLCYRCYC